MCAACCHAPSRRAAHVTHSLKLAVHAQGPRGVKPSSAKAKPSSAKKGGTLAPCACCCRCARHATCSCPTSLLLMAHMAVANPVWQCMPNNNNMPPPPHPLPPAGAKKQQPDTSQSKEYVFTAESQAIDPLSPAGAAEADEHAGGACCVLCARACQVLCCAVRAGCKPGPCQSLLALPCPLGCTPCARTSCGGRRGAWLHGTCAWCSCCSARYKQPCACAYTYSRARTRSHTHTYTCTFCCPQASTSWTFRTPRRP